MKKKTTNHTYFVFIFYFFGGGGKIYHFLRVICILFTKKKTLEKSKKLQITRKISFKFLLGGPPEIVKSPSPPSPKIQRNFMYTDDIILDHYPLITYLVSPLCLGRSLSP